MCPDQTVNHVTGLDLGTVYVYEAGGELAAEYGGSTGGSGPEFLTGDHLGSVRLVTDGSGGVKQRRDYGPFGEELETAGRTAGLGYGTVAGSRVRFTGKERDGETGLDWFSPGRYFSASSGRFTSTDPLNIPALQVLQPKQFAVILQNPQNWNQYAYAHNSPLTKIDPDGYLTIIVPGTWNNNKEWSGSPFRKQVEKAFGEKAVVIANNDMGNDKDSRSATARQINEIVKNHKFADGEKLNVVAHSHGGNAVFEATKTGLDRKIDNLITLGTPIRSDYRPDFGKIGNFLNVFSRNDQVQTNGGGFFGLGDADRQIRRPEVQNLDATSTATGHSDLWKSPGTWTTLVEPRLKK